MLHWDLAYMIANSNISRKLLSRCLNVLNMKYRLMVDKRDNQHERVNESTGLGKGVHSPSHRLLTKSGKE